MSGGNYETFGTVRADGTLELDERLHAPPGRVRVRLEPVDLPARPATDLVEYVRAMRERLAAAGHRFRSKEEIDAEIAELRNEWDADADPSGPEC